MGARTKAIKQQATKRQQSFIENLEKGTMTDKEAAKEAGYNPSTNAAIAKRSPIIQKALRSIENNTKHLTSLERQDVIEGILSAIQLAENLDDPATMIRGWNEIARLHGFHAAEKKELSVSGAVQHSHSGDLKLEQMSTSQLLELSNKENAIDISPDDYKQIDNERRAQSEEGESNDSPSDDLEFFDPTDDDQ